MSSLTERRNARARHLNHINNTRGASPMKRSTNTMVVTTSTKNVSTTSEDCNPPRSNSRIPSSSSKSVISSPDEKIDSQNVQSKSNVASKVNRLRRHRMRSRSPAVARNSNLPPNDIPNPNPSKRTLSDNNSDIKGSSVSGNSTSVNEILPTEADVTSKEQNNQVQSIPPQTSKTLKRRTADQRHRIEKLQQHRRHEAQKKNIAAQEHLDSELGKTNQEVESSLGNDGTSKAAQQLETKNESILSRRKRVQKIQAQRHKTLGLKDVTFTSDNDAHSIISISTIDTDKKLDDMFIVNNNTGQTHENDNDILAHDTETDHDYAPDPDDILPILDNDDIHNEKSPDVLQHKFKSRLQENLGFSNNTGMPQGMIPENIEGIQNSSPSADFSPSTINTNSFNHSPMSISHSNPISHPVPNNENYASPPSYQNEFPHRNQHFPSYLGNMPISPPNSKNQGQGQGQGYTHFSPTQGHPSMQSLSSSFPPISPSSPLSQVQSSFSRTPQHQIISPNNSNFDNSTMASVPASSSFVSPTQYAPSNTGSHYPESTVASEFTGAGTIGSLSAAGVPIANDMEMERRRLQSNDQEAWRLQQVELELQRRVVREAEINRIRLEEEHKRAKMKEMEQNLEITRLRMEHDKMKMEEERLAQKVQLAKLMSEQELQQRVLELKQEEIEAQAERLKEEKEALVIEAEKVRHIHEEEHQKRTQELESQKKRLIEERKQMNNKQNEQNLKEQQEQIKEQKISHDKKPDQQQEEMANDSESQDDSSQQQHSQSTTSIVLHSSRYDYGNELMKTSKSNFHKTMKSGLKDKSDRSKSSSTTMREDDDVITSLPSESPNFKLNESQDSKLTTLDYTDGDLSTEEISLGAGSQVLSDWWQRNYASSQDPEINNVIKQALSTTPKSPLDTSSQFTDDSKSTFTQSIDKTNFKHQMKIMNKASSSHADSDDEDIFSGIGDGTESESESIQYPERSKINKDSNGPKDNDKLKKPVTKTSTAFDKKSSLTSLKPKVAIGTKSFANNKSTPSPITTNYQSKNTRTSQEKRNDKNQRSNRFKNEETSTNFRKTSRKVEDNLFPAFERNAFDHEGDNMEKNVDKFTKVKKEKIQKSDLSPSDFQAMPFPKSDNDPYFQAAKSQKEKKDTGTRHDKGSLPLKHEEKNSRPLSSSFTYSDASHGSGPSFALSKAPRDTPQKHPIKEYQNSTSLMDALSPTSPTEDSAVSGYTEEFEPPALHIKNDKKHRDESPQTRANRKLNYSSMTAPDDEYEAELEKNKKNINGNLKRSGDLLNKFNNEATPNKTQNNEYDSTSNTQKYDDEEEASEENEIEKGKSEYGAEESTAEITNVLDETGSRSVDKRSKSKNISKAYQRKDLDDDDYSSEDDDSYYTEDMTDASSRDKFNQDKDERTAKSKDSSKKNEMQSFFSHYGCHMLDTLTSTICRDPNQKEKDISISKFNIV